MRRQRSGLGHRVAIQLAAVVVAGAAVLAIGTPAGAGDLRYACPPAVAGCTVVTGTPIDLPAGHGIDELVKHDQITCPSGLPVGYSYSTGDVGQTQVFVQVWPSYPNTNNISNPTAAGPRTVFFEIVHTGAQTTVQDLVGCAPEPPGKLLNGAAAPAAGHIETRTAPLERPVPRMSFGRAGEPRYECPPTVGDCTSVTGGWLDVPPSDYFQSRDISVRAQLTCPAGLPVGFTYSGGEAGFTRVLVQVFRGSRGPNPDTVFFAIVNYGHRTTVQPRIGCAPAPTATTLGSGPARSVERAETWRVILERSQVRSYSRSCPAGTRLLTGGATVEFLAAGKPSAAELAAAHWQTTRHGSTETVRVTTTRALGRSRAELEMFALCATA
jgi:hypothetical protein